MYVSIFISSCYRDADYSNFVQLIWANTYMIGCGVALCHHRLEDTLVNETGKEYAVDLNEGESLLLTVCNYAPGGLVDGKSVFLMGGPCSLCTRLHTNDTGGIYCSKEFISLCSGKIPWDLFIFFIISIS